MLRALTRSRYWLDRRRSGSSARRGPRSRSSTYASTPSFSEADQGALSRSPSNGLDLRHDLLLQPLHVVERLRDRHVLEWRPEERHRQPGLTVTPEVVSDLGRRPNHQIGGFAPRSLIGLLVGDREPDHAADFQIVDRAGAPEFLEFTIDRG